MLHHDYNVALFALIDWKNLSGGRRREGHGAVALDGVVGSQDAVGEPSWAAVHGRVPTTTTATTTAATTLGTQGSILCYYCIFFSVISLD